jgi:hypothetical protein
LGSQRPLRAVRGGAPQLLRGTGDY